MRAMTFDDRSDIAPIDQSPSAPFLGAAELGRRWHHLYSPLGFREASVCVGFVRASALVPPLLELPGSECPNGFHADMLMRRLRGLVAADACDGFAILLSRPGGDRLNAWDTAWSNLLDAAARRHSVLLYGIHRANDNDVISVPTEFDEAA